MGADPRRGEAAVATPGAALDCVRNWLELLAAFDEVSPISPTHGPSEPSSPNRSGSAGPSTTR